VGGAGILMNATEVLCELYRMGAQVSVDEGRLRIQAHPGCITPELDSAIRCQKADLLLQAGQCFILNGHWHGPNLYPLQWGICMSCGWLSPLPSGLSVCPLCEKSEQRRQEKGELLRCEMFCNAALVTIQRTDPGGPLCCPACLTKIAMIRERAIL